MESHTHLTTNNETSKLNPREKLKQKLLSKKKQIEELFNKYQLSLNDGTFLDKEDEEFGQGDKRKEAMQEILTDMLNKAEKMKQKLDSNEEIIEEINEEIEVDYSFLNKQTNKVEYQENIKLNIEQKLNEYIEFYKENNIALPPNFEDEIKELWNDNIDEIEKEIKDKGYNEILLVPETTNLPDLAEKMKEKIYVHNNDFTDGGGFEKAKSQNQNKIRLILTHNTQNLKDHPVLRETLNTYGRDVPQDITLSLEEYLILCKKYFKETGKHLDKSTVTWLATQVDISGGSRLVDSRWDSDDWRYVYADDFSSQYGDLGFRSSRQFFK
jgi:hypothetical protein